MRSSNRGYDVCDKRMIVVDDACGLALKTLPLIVTPLCANVDSHNLICLVSRDYFPTRTIFSPR